MTTPILEVKNLNTYYDGSHILHDTNFVLEKGIQCVIGKNGMGKTTLMNSIMGIVKPRSGQILLKGENIAGLKPYQIAQRGIGYVPQGRQVFASLTVDQHLHFADRKQLDPDIQSQWDADRVYELFPRLKERYKSYGTNLSGGEQQMLAIGRALVTNPFLLIMDEPSEGLAPIIVEQLIEAIHTLIETGISIILVEQSIYAASKASDHVNVMLTGKIEYTGSITELLADKRLTNRLLSIGD